MREPNFSPLPSHRGVKSHFNLPVFLAPPPRRLPTAVNQQCLAPEIASGMGGEGEQEGCEGAARSLREALLSSDRSFPPRGPKWMSRR
jgi:hypothetical protein